MIRPLTGGTSGRTMPSHNRAGPTIGGSAVTEVTGASTGLEARAISLRHVLSQGCIANGPLASVTVALTGAAFYGLGALPFAMVAASVLILLYVNTTYQFSKHLQSAGGIYQLVRAGFGEGLAGATGTSYSLANLLLVAANALIAPSLFDAAMAALGWNPPGWTWVLVAAVTLAAPFLLGWYRVRPTLDYGIVTATIEVVVIVGLSVYFVVHAGGHNTFSVFDPTHARNGWGGVGVAMALSSVALGGADNVLALGEESHAPQSTIKRSVLTVQLAVVAVYIFASYALTVAWGPAKMGSFAASGSPLLTLAGRAGGHALVVIIALLALNSIIGVNVAVNITVARMVFDFGRQGFLPRSMARTHPHHRTPTTGLLACLGVEALATFVPEAIWGLTTGFIVVITAATAGYIVQQLITSAALIGFARRRRIQAVLFYVVIPLAACLLLAYSLYGNLWPLSIPNSLGVFILLAAVILAGIVAATRLRGRAGPGNATGAPAAVEVRA